LYFGLQYVSQLHVSAHFKAIFRLYTLGLESNVSYIQIYYNDDEISVIILQF